MRHYQNCPVCSGNGIIRDSRGLGDLCPNCGGKGYIISTERGKPLDNPLMKIIFYSAMFLIVFYASFIIYITYVKISFTETVIILFIGHVVLAASLISYFMIRAIHSKM